MRNFLFTILAASLTILSTGCTKGNPHVISILEKQIQQAEKDKIRADQKIMALQVSLSREQIAYIRQEIHDFPFAPTSIDLEARELFLEEREKLSRIIEETPLCAAEAQALLDEILALITRLSMQQR